MARQSSNEFDERGTDLVRPLLLGPVAATGKHLDLAQAGNEALQARLGQRTCRGRLRGQLRLLLANELFERLRLGAADFFDRVRHGEPRGLRRKAGGPQRLPERGQMFDRMRIPAARENLAPPLLVGNLLVVDVPIEASRKS